jgi:hypothetical protein
VSANTAPAAAAAIGSCCSASCPRHTTAATLATPTTVSTSTSTAAGLLLLGTATSLRLLHLLLYALLHCGVWGCVYVHIEHTHIEGAAAQVLNQGAQPCTHNANQGQMCQTVIA